METDIRRASLFLSAQCVVEAANPDNLRSEEKETFVILADSSISNPEKEKLLEQLLVSKK